MTTVDDLQRFFTAYGDALAAGDLEGVADAYAYPSLVLGGPDIILVGDRDAVKGAFAGAAEQHRADGYTRATPDLTAVDDGGHGAVWVAVTWTYSSDDGEQTRLDAYRYLLRDHDGSLTIAALATAPAPDAGSGPR